MGKATGHSPLAVAASQTPGPNGIYVFSGVPGQHSSTPIAVNSGREDYVEAARILEHFMVLFPCASRTFV